MAGRTRKRIVSERHEVRNRYGKRIVVIAYHPDKPVGLVFIAHGLGGNKGQKHIALISDVFSDAGYTAVRFDVTHTYGESEGLYEHATATNYLHDLKDVIKWAKAQTWYQEPFCLAGHSLGALTAAIYAEENPRKIKALAPLSAVISGMLHTRVIPPSELAECRKTGWRVRPSSSEPGLIKRLRWRPFEKDLKRYDLLKNSALLNMPVLMVVGEKDTSTPPSQQRLLYARLRGKKELHIVKGAPHTFVEPAHLAMLRQILREWVSRL